MTTKKYSIITVISITTLILILIYTFFISSTKAYADEITEATVTSEGTDATVTSDSTQVVQTSRQAPVSIAIYSNEVTESSDTYDYSVKVDNSNPVEITTPTATQAPDGGAAPGTDTGIQPSIDPGIQVTNPPTTSGGTGSTTRDPRSTAAPDATEEPDIITYEATVAPAYTD